jgi:hypothetical protein
MIATHPVVIWLGRRLRTVLTIVGAVVLGIVLFFLSQRNALPVCIPPNVAIQELDARLTGIGCATIGPYAAAHGVWIDAADAAWFYPGTDTPPPPDQLHKTNGWIFVTAEQRKAIYDALPDVDPAEKVRDQAVAVSFVGTEYRIDQANKYGIHRFYDIGKINSARLLRRDFISSRSTAE